MRRTPANLASAFALLAILLQAAIVAMGGHVCYRITTLPPASQSQQCASTCCIADEAPDRSDVSNANVSDATPIAPGDSNCCVAPGDVDLTHSTVQTTVKQLDLVAPPIVATQMNQSDHDDRMRLMPVERTAHPPPSLTVVRTTVLLI